MYAWDYLGNQEGDDSYRPPIVDLRMSPRGSQYRDGSSNALTSRPEYHNNPNTQVPKLPPTERPIGTPRTTYGGVAGLAGLAADSMSKGLPGFLRANGWRMCHDQVAYSLEGVMKRCCCCIITIQMLIQPGTTRNMLIPGMLGHGVVVKGSCRDAMKLDIEQGTLGQRYNPISPFRYWLHDKVNLPLPKPPPQTTEVFYEDWGCAE